MGTAMSLLCLLISDIALRLERQSRILFGGTAAKFGFDADGQMAGKSRRAMLEYAAKGKRRC